jgi:hypothetical protein
MPILEMLGDGRQSIFGYGDIHEVMCVGTDLSAVITWVGLGLCAAEPHHFSSCVRVN